MILMEIVSNKQDIEEIINVRGLLGRMLNTLVSQYKLIYSLDSFVVWAYICFFEYSKNLYNLIPC